MKRQIRLMALLCMALILITGTKMAEASTKLVLQDFPQDTAYIEAVDVLTALGILRGDSSGELNLDSTITRAEAATVICRLLGVEEDAQIYKISTFSDVPDSHWAAGYVAKVAELGIVDGYGDGRFGPGDPVTHQQIIKMLVCAMDYETEAIELGGWFSGYLNIAQQFGIVSLDETVSAEPASRAAVSIYLYNFINIE